MPSPVSDSTSDPAQRLAVEHPQLPRAVLHAHRAVEDERIEAIAVEGTGERLVVAHRPHPPVTGRRPQAGEPVRRDVDGLPRRGHRHEVDVVVVETRQHGAAGDVHDGVAPPAPRPDVGDEAVRAAHVDEAAVAELRVAQQDGGRRGQASTGTSAIAAAIASSGSS